MAFSLFPAFFDRPDRIHFATQDPDEHIELLLRQHWVTNLSWIFVSLLAVVLPVVVLSLDGINGISVQTQVPSDVLLGILVAWYLFVIAYILEKYLYWYFNIYIVTNENVVDIAFLNLLSLYSTGVEISDVQSTRYSFRGILGSLFGFGDVQIETAAEKQVILFISVPRPDLVRDRIQDLQEAREVTH